MSDFDYIRKLGKKYDEDPKLIEDMIRSLDELEQACFKLNPNKSFLNE